MSMAWVNVRHGPTEEDRVGSYMDGPIALLHMVGSEKIGDAS